MDQQKSTMSNKKLRPDMPSILSLPNEVIINILEHVTSIKDKINFSITCIRLHNLFNSTRKLHHNKLVKVTNQGFDTFFTVFLKQQDKKIRHIIITNIHFDECKQLECLDKFWNEYGGNVISLSIFDCDHQEDDDDVLRRIVSYCPNLEVLKLCSEFYWTSALNKCSELKYEKLEKLVSIVLSDYSLNNFLKNAPNLKLLGFYEYMPLLKNNNEEDVNTEYLSIKNLLCVLPPSNITFSRSTISFSAEQMHEIKKMGLWESLCQLRQKGLKVESEFHRNYRHISL